MKEIEGNRYGKLIALKRTEIKDKKGNYYYLCECDCGAQKNILRCHLVTGKIRSCGCLHKGINATHNDSGSLEYSSYSSMIGRCYNKNNAKYPIYGGRGIKVCDRWLESYSNFLEDMGRKPIGTSIDRINNDGNYEPLNCRWASASTQSRNRSNTKISKYIAQYIRERVAKRKVILNELKGICTVAIYKNVKSNNCWV